MNGLESIAEERIRQYVVEGFGPEHDNEHINNEMVRAAVCYAFMGMHTQQLTELKYTLECWPFSEEWLKVNTGKGGMRRNLVKAGALLAAEIDRLDRIERMG